VIFQLNACRVPIRVQQLSSAAIRWSASVSCIVDICKGLELLGIRLGRSPVFFNSPGELAALLSRHVT
jgi:hypothetical protein